VRRLTAGKSVARISILKPLAGLDDGLEDNLRSFLEQDYPNLEILFAVRTEDDPSVPIVRRLIAQYPAVPSKLIVTGEPPYPHAKVYSLKCMLEEAGGELIAMSDSDVRVGRDFCRELASEFANERVGLLTCPYRAVSGNAIWSRLEAIGMNTDFHAGLFTAVMMEGAAKFAVGPTIVARRDVLLQIGGIERVKDYLGAEDFMLGRIAGRLGFVVGLSSYVVEHRIGSESMLQNFSHRMRWGRTSRRSRPLGYIGQFFTYPVPVALALLLMHPAYWPLFVMTAALRSAAAWMVSDRVLGARVDWLLLPAQDFLAFGFWIAGFFGKEICWRGRRYTLNRDGTVQMAG
jgi:ceramide glucosyltransferase